MADPAADVTLPGVSYGTVSDYRNVPPGTYTVSMRKAGADPKTPPVLSTTVEVGDGAARTVAGVGNFADLGLRVLQDDLATPPAGRARMRVVAAAAQAGTVDVSIPGGTSVASRLPFAATSGYVDVPAGQTALQVAPAGSAATSLPVTVAPGAVYSVLVLDKPGGGLTVRPILDAAGPGVVPAGSVPAGEGGTAGTFPGQAVVLTSAGRRRARGPRAARHLRAAPGPPPADGSRGRLTRGTPPRGPPGRPASRRCGAARGGRGALLRCRRRRVGDRRLRPGRSDARARRRRLGVRRPASPPLAVRLADGSTPVGGVPAPVAVRLPRIGVDSPLVPLAVDASGALVPPEDTATAGWFTQGTLPGAVGPAVIAGHVDSYRGPGVFFRLREVTPGEVVLVDRATGRRCRSPSPGWTATPRRRSRPTGLRAHERAELRLITCGGAFDRSERSYEDNVVVLPPGSPASAGGARWEAPAGGVPVPAQVGRRVGVPGVEVGVPRVGRPGDHVRRRRADLLVAPRAAVGLGARRAGQRADHPVAVRPPPRPSHAVRGPAAGPAGRPSCVGAPGQRLA